MSAGIEVEVQVAEAFEGVVAAERLRAAAEAALRREGAAGEVTLVVADDAGIQALNRDFRGIDAPTNVLAFSAREEAGGFVSAPEAGAYLGDVILSFPRAAAQAEEQGHPVAQELALLVVHGVLHLLGYDHAEAEEQAAMWARQAAVLDSL